jgi:hypothetical protein
MDVSGLDAVGFERNGGRRTSEDEGFVLLDRVGGESGQGALDLSFFLDKWRIS